MNSAERAEARRLEKQYDDAKTEGQMRAIERKAMQLEKKVNGRLDRGFGDNEDKAAPSANPPEARNPIK